MELFRKWRLYRRKTNKKRLFEGVFNSIYILFLCLFIWLFFASCASTRNIYFDNRGDERVRESLGELKGREQNVDDEAKRLEELSREIERGVGEENDLIKRIADIIRRIRERNKNSSSQNESHDTKARGKNKIIKKNNFKINYISNRNSINTSSIEWCLVVLS